MKTKYHLLIVVASKNEDTKSMYMLNSRTALRQINKKRISCNAQCLTLSLFFSLVFEARKRFTMKKSCHANALGPKVARTTNPLFPETRESVKILLKFERNK